MIRPHIPEKKRLYVEPFLGGGAVFWDLDPDTPALLGDTSDELMNFYQHVQALHVLDRDRDTTTFLHYLKEFAHTWELLAHDAKRLRSVFAEIVSTYRLCDDPYFMGMQPGEELGKRVTNPEQVLLDKAKTVVRQERRAGKTFTNYQDQCEGALKAAYYTQVRTSYNKARTVPPLSQNPRPRRAYLAAAFFFLRQFCYGSMFRYNRRGEFNIPYGGLSYNKRRFRDDVMLLKSGAIRQHLHRVQFVQADFEECFKDRHPDDFLFLDPPYDTDFSSYSGNAFGEEDQRRLARALGATPAQWTLVVKQTPLMESLYREVASMRPGVTLREFDKKYGYNVKGRNDRDVVHLLVTTVSDRSGSPAQL